MATVPRPAVANTEDRHYFSGKESILYWVHEEYGALLIERLEERAASNLSARDNLRLLALDLIGRTETHRGHVRMSFEYERESDPLDAVRAARETLARTQLGMPRGTADRQALSVRGSCSAW